MVTAVWTARGYYTVCFNGIETSGRQPEGMLVGLGYAFIFKTGSARVQLLRLPLLEVSRRFVGGAVSESLASSSPIRGVMSFA